MKTYSPNAAGSSAESNLNVDRARRLSTRNTLQAQAVPLGLRYGGRAVLRNMISPHATTVNAVVHHHQRLGRMAAPYCRARVDTDFAISARKLRYAALVLRIIGDMISASSKCEPIGHWTVLCAFLRANFEYSDTVGRADNVRNPHSPASSQAMPTDISCSVPQEIFVPWSLEGGKEGANYRNSSPKAAPARLGSEQLGLWRHFHVHVVGIAWASLAGKCKGRRQGSWL